MRVLYPDELAMGITEWWAILLIRTQKRWEKQHFFLPCQGLSLHNSWVYLNVYSFSLIDGGLNAGVNIYVRILD
jgi:hypothetical protein